MLQIHIMYNYFIILLNNNSNSTINTTSKNNGLKKLSTEQATEVLDKTNSWYNRIKSIFESDHNKLIRENLKQEDLKRQIQENLNKQIQENLNKQEEHSLLTSFFNNFIDCLNTNNILDLDYWYVFFSFYGILNTILVVLMVKWLKKISFKYCFTVVQSSIGVFILIGIHILFNFFFVQGRSYYSFRDFFITIFGALLGNLAWTYMIYLNCLAYEDYIEWQFKRPPESINCAFHFGESWNQDKDIAAMLKGLALFILITSLYTSFIVTFHIV